MFRQTQQLCLVILLSVPSQASTFNPNCSIPSTSFSYVEGSDVRGTFDILWSCLATLLLCTWSVQHPNVPEQRPQDQSRWDGLILWARGFWSKTKWLLITLIFPEFLVGRAIQDWLVARRSVGDPFMEELLGGQKWSIVHSFYANMGGFVLKIKDEQPPEPTRSFKIISARPLNQLETPFLSPEYHEMELAAKESQPKAESKNTGSKGITTYDSGKKDHECNGPTDTRSMPVSENLRDLETASESKEEVLLHVNTSQLRLILSWKLIKGIPKISREEIENRGDGDIFAKGAAIFQVLWMAIQVIARAINHLPITQLEIATLAFAVCAFLTYIFSWDKPHNVRLATFIGTATLRDTLQLEQLYEEASTSFFKQLAEFIIPKRFFGHNLHSLFVGDSTGLKQGLKIKSPIFGALPNDSVCNADNKQSPKVIIPFPGTKSEPLDYEVLGTGAMISGIVFGAIHCLAWDFHFPSPIEQTLWRISSIVCTGVLLLHPLTHTTKVLLWIKIPWMERNFWIRRTMTIIAGWVSMVTVVGYTVARVFLMVEVFRSLLFLPPEAFVGSWSAEIPHVG